MTMFTVEEVADKLRVSKVTVYSKLKKYNDMVVLKQGKKYVTEDLLRLIKQDLKVKDIEKECIKDDDYRERIDDEIATDRYDLINLNKELINTLIDQLNIKDKQLEEKDRHITELHKLIENSQVLLKQENEVKQLQLEEHLKEVDARLNNVKEKMTQRKKQRENFFVNLFKK